MDFVQQLLQMLGIPPTARTPVTSRSPERIRFGEMPGQREMQPPPLLPPARMAEQPNQAGMSDMASSMYGPSPAIGSVSFAPEPMIGRPKQQMAFDPQGIVTQRPMGSASPRRPPTTKPLGSGGMRTGMQRIDMTPARTVVGWAGGAEPGTPTNSTALSGVSTGGGTDWNRVFNDFDNDRENEASADVDDFAPQNAVRQRAIRARGAPPVDDRFLELYNSLARTRMGA